MTSLTADWTGAVNGVTFGQGTNYRWRPTGFSGLALPGFRTTDLSRGPQVAGVSSSFDTLDGRLLVFPITIGRSTATLTQQNFQTLKTAFKPSTSDTTLDLPWCSLFDPRNNVLTDVLWQVQPSHSFPCRPPRGVTLTPHAHTKPRVGRIITHSQIVHLPFPQHPRIKQAAAEQYRVSVC